MTGKLFPSGKQQELLPVQPPSSLPHIEPFEARITLIDSANPFIFVDAAYISTQILKAQTPDEQHALVEAIRQQAAVVMGLAESPEAASKTRGTPKIALTYAPLRQAGKTSSDIRISAYSMGLPHPTLQLSGAVCVASGLCCSGTILSDLAANPIVADGAPVTPERTPSPPGAKESTTESSGHARDVVIEHSKGTIDASVVATKGADGEERIVSCSVSRTARRLFEGNVRYFI
jgi:2-methylaconitate cis-trans-isomerase PrpF